MPAPIGIRAEERAIAIGAVATVQVALLLALLNGLRVSTRQPVETIPRMIEISVPRLRSRIPPPQVEKPRLERRFAAATAASPKPVGLSAGPRPTPAPSSIVPVVDVRASAAASGGGVAAGAASGSGAGG